VTVRNQYKPDKSGWSRTGPHKWKHLEGFIIARYWTLGVKKKDYFSCFINEDLYYQGVNEKSFSSLKAAKNYLVPLGPDLVPTTKIS